MLNQIEKNNELKAGNYYKRRANPKPKKKEHYQAGDLVLVLEVDENDQDVSYTAYTDNSWSTLPISDFLYWFQYEPNGRAIRDAEFQGLLNQASSLAAEITDDAEQLQNIDQSFKPNLLPGRTELETPDLLPNADIPADQPSVSLTRINPASDTLTAANKWIGDIATRRDDINDKKDQLSKYQKRIEGLQKEMKAWMECLTSFKDITKKLNEVIGNLNLYLGSDEEIIQLANGEPCSLNVPLSIRQLVLYMDEECALNAENGGIDARSISQFDEWLLADPRNLDQVLPEPKGIVCLKPKRKEVEYTKDSYTNSKLNEANKETYILIRNGANLFRLLTSWQTGDYFFPTKTEFEKYEYETFYDYGIGRNTTTEHRKIVPKDGYKYTEMLEKIERLEKHYSRALILLQGIVDRTGIFPELQNIGLNLMDVSVHNQYLRFIHDGDPSKLLVTGRETFHAWQKRINQTLTAGDRIIGLFNYHYADKSRTRSEYSGRPDTETLYTLEKGSPLRVMIESSGYSWRDRKNRVSYQIHKSDGNIIAFDQITLEDCDYFLTDRLSRSEYMDMFPLIRRVRDLKRIEREEEQPFIDLLVYKAAEYIGQMEKGIEAKIREVVLWYKFKNKVHRSLAEDDQKAFRMIMAEWTKRRLTEAGDHDSENIIGQIETDQTILIARRDNVYIRIERADKNFIFTHRTSFKIKNGKAVEFDRREWKMIGKEHLLWMPIYTHKDWEEWPKGARIEDYFTPAEFESGLSGMKAKAIEKLTASCQYYLSGHSRGEAEYRGLQLHPFRINISRETVQLFYWLEAYAKGTNEHLYAEMGTEFRWHRSKNGVEFHFRTYNGYSEGYHSAVDTVADKSWNPEKEESFTYWVDKAELFKMDKIRSDKSAVKKIKDHQRWAVTRIFDSIRSAINGQREEVAKQAYIDNHGDPRNWESYRQRVKIGLLDRNDFNDLEESFLKAIRKAKIISDEPFIGRSVIDLFTEFVPDWESGIMNTELDMELIPIPEPEPDEPEDDDELNEQPGDIIGVWEN